MCRLFIADARVVGCSSKEVDEFAAPTNASIDLSCCSPTNQSRYSTCSESHIVKYSLHKHRDIPRSYLFRFISPHSNGKLEKNPRYIEVKYINPSFYFLNTIRPIGDTKIPIKFAFKLTY